MPTACVFVQARCTQCISADPSPPSGLRWEGSYYYERFLPFGLRSSPAVFDSVATAVNWIMQHEFAIDHRLHYLDDFLDISTGLAAANQQLTTPPPGIHVSRHSSLLHPSSRAITIIDLGIFLDCGYQRTSCPRSVRYSWLLSASAASASVNSSPSWGSSLLLPESSFLDTHSCVNYDQRALNCICVCECGA